MIIQKFRKIIASFLSLALTGTMIPCGAANLVPFNAVKPVVTPAVPVTTPLAESKPSSDGFSMQSLESKVNDIIAPEQNKGLQEVYSGDCGDNAHWHLNTETGVLTIFGSGEMWNYLSRQYYSDTNPPWYSYKDSIKSVDIRDGITFIGNWAFGKWYYSEAFRKLSSVTIPNSVTKIGNDAFKSSVLTSLNLPNNILTICDEAFYDCDELTSINIPDKVIDIGGRAFNHCKNLVTVSLGKGIKNIGSDAFADCTRLTSVTLNNYYEVANFKTIFPNYAKITTVTLGEGITEIPDNAFMGCEKLKSITVPDSVKSIGKYAFAFCSNLDDFKYLGTTSPTVVENAFDDCPNLKAIKVTSNYLDDECCGLPLIRFGVCGNNLTWELQPSTGRLDVFGSGQMINYTANSPAPWNTYKTDIKSINIGEGVKSIGNNAFTSCNNLNSVDLPSSITSIGNSAFSGCEGLTTLSLGKGITTIGANAFASCKSLSSVSFYGLTEPNNDETAFVQCDLLVEANVPTTYDKDTFCGLSVAKTLIVPIETPTPSAEDLPTNSTTAPESPKLSTGDKVAIGLSVPPALYLLAVLINYFMKKCSGTDDINARNVFFCSNNNCCDNCC